MDPTTQLVTDAWPVLGILAIALAAGVVLWAMTRDMRRTVGILFFGLLLLMATGVIFTVVRRGETDRREAVRESLRELGPRLHRSAPVTQTARAERSSQAEIEVFPDELKETADENRPEWVDAAPRLDKEGKYGAYHTSAKSGFHANDRDARAALNEAIQERIAGYIDNLPGLGADAHYRVELDPRYIEDHIVKDLYTETRDFERAGENMLQMHARLEFDSDVRDTVFEQYRRGTVEERLWLFAGAAGLLLIVVGAVYSYLKLDTATKGYYSGRLTLAAAAVVLSALTLGCLAGYNLLTYGSAF